MNNDKSKSKKTDFDSIRALTPLKVLIVAQKSDSSGELLTPFVNAITRAFQGGTTRSPDGIEDYYALGEDLGVDVFRAILDADGHITDSVPNWKSNDFVPDVEKFKKSCGHLLVIVFLTEDIKPDSEFCKWLEKLATTAITNDRDEIGILPVVVNPAAEKLSIDNFTEFEHVRVYELGEPALRAGYLGLLALQNAWSLLEHGSNEKLRLFVSHAKLDGTPIALSLKSEIESLPFLERFYDAQDILPGTRWRKVLENGVRKSVLVVLRTDVYERRAWCVQEMEWAEEYSCPAIVVDARTASAMPRESLQVFGMATMKISDGNLVRVLNGALREALRVQLFRHSIHDLEEAGALPKDQTLALVRTSLSALGVVCEKAKTDYDKAKTIYHEGKKQNPQTKLHPPNFPKVVVTIEPFRESVRPAAEKLVQSYFKKSAHLGTLRDYAEKVSHENPLISRLLERKTAKKNDDWVIGLSISFAEELSDVGYNLEDVKRATIRLSELLLSAGARLVFGDDWRPDGVMDAICRIAVKYQPHLEGKTIPKPLIQCLVAWPHEPNLDSEVRRDLEQRGVLKVEKVPLPKGDWAEPNGALCRAIALSEMRHTLTECTNALICLGGDKKSDEGFFDAIVEDAYNTVVAQHPLFIGSFLGGTAKKLALSLEDPSIKHKYFKRSPPPLTEELFNKLIESEFAKLRAYGQNNLSSAFETNRLRRQSGLKIGDWNELLKCDDVVTFSTLVMRGLRKKIPAKIGSTEK